MVDDLASASLVYSYTNSISIDFFGFEYILLILVFLTACFGFR